MVSYAGRPDRSKETPEATQGHSNEVIVHALHQVEGGEKVAEVCRRLGVSEQTFYRCKKQFAGLGLSRCASCGRCATRTPS